MKRIAAVLGLAGFIAIGASSSASAAGDPLHVTVCNNVLDAGCAKLADVSVRQAAPGVAFLLNCDPAQQAHIPIPYGLGPVPPLLTTSFSGQADVYICQP